MPNNPNPLMSPDLPIPQAADVKVHPAAIPPPQMNDAAMGYSGKTGSALNIAEGLMRGFMMGHQIAAQRKMQQAHQQIQGANAMWELAVNRWHELLAQGKDPKSNDPDVVRARNALTAAHANKVHIYERYMFPDDAEGGKSKKKKGNIFERGAEDLKKGLFGGVDPQLVSKGVLEAYAKTDPMTLAGGPSPEQSAENIKLQQMRHQQELQQHVEAMRAQYDSTLQQYQKASGPMRQQLYDQLLMEGRQLETYGAKMPTIPSPSSEALTNEADRAKLEGLQSLRAGHPLTPEQSLILGQDPKNAMGAYLSEVGPGKRFKTNVDAVKALMADQANANAHARAMNRQPTAFEEKISLIRGALRDRLHRNPTEDEVADVVLGKAADALPASSSGSHSMSPRETSILTEAINSVLQKSKVPREEWKNFYIADTNGNFRLRTPQEKLSPWTYNGDTSQGKVPPYVVKGGSYYGGFMPADKAADMEAEFRAQVGAAIQTKHPEISQGELQRMLGSPVYARQPSGQSEKNAGMTPPPPRSSGKDSDLVAVQLPDGQRGTVPRSSLPQIEKMGGKVIDGADDEVRVELPNGQRGTVPRSNLAAMQRLGAKVIQ